MEICKKRSIGAYVAIAIAIASASASGKDKPAPPPAKTTSAKAPKQYTIEQFLDTVGVGGASFSPDESKILFHSNKTGIWNVYTMPVAGGEWTPVTHSTKESTYSVSYFPADERVLITHDEGGNELDHLYVIEKDGTERDLTPGDKLKAMFGGFNRKGDTFYVLSNERDPKYFDGYAYDAKTYDRKLIFKNEQGYQPGAISEDQRYVALVKPNTTNDNDLYLADLKSGKTTLISKHEGVASFDPQEFDPASKHLYFTTNDGGEFTRLARYDIENGAFEDVDSAKWDVVFARLSQTGRYRLVGVNEDGATKVTLRENESGKEVALPPIPGGEIRGVAISRSEKRLAFYVNGDRMPNELFVAELGSSKPAKKLTSALNPQIDPDDLVDSSVVRFKSFDGMQIPNILLKPKQADAKHKAPALVWVHGGPGGQTTRGYSDLRQYLANHGYVVLGINNRGSSGYGKTFLASDDGKHGREPLWDCVEAKKYLQSLDYVDGKRIGIIGGSYGGYMTLAALAFKPDEFRVGVDIFGVANWVRTLESIPAWWEAERNALYTEIGDPKTQHDFLVETSPLFHADKIKRPLLVLQGANDPRVLKAESDDMVAAVKKNDVPVEYVVFDDEGHGFTKKKNQAIGYGRVLTFLDKYLKAP